MAPSRPSLPAKTPGRSLFVAVAMLLGILLLAIGHYGNTITLVYGGVLLILVGVMTFIVALAGGQSPKTSSDPAKR